MEDSHLECVRSGHVCVYPSLIVCDSYFRKLNSNDHWCECADGTDLIEGWCVATYLKEARRRDYIRIQKDLLKVKDRLGRGQPGHATEPEESPLFISLLRVTLLLAGSFVILLGLIIMARKIALYIAQFSSKKSYK